MHPGLRYAHKTLNFLCRKKNVFQEKKLGLRLKKKLLGKSFVCCQQKNASHTGSIYGNCMISIFLTINFFFVRYTDFYAKTRKKIFENLAKCMKFV